MVVWSVIAIFNAASGIFQAVYSVCAFLSFGLFWLMRRGEKYIAQRCIEAWVNQPVEESQADSIVRGQSR